MIFNYTRGQFRSGYAFPRLILILAFITCYHSGYSINLDSLRNLTLKSNTIPEKINAYLMLSKAFRKSNLDSAYFYALKSFSMAEAEKEKASYAEVYGNLGDIAVMKDSLVMALAYYNQAAQLYQEKQNYRELVKVLVVLGNINLVMENVPEALDRYLQGVQISEEHNDRSSLGNLYNNIGIVYYQTNEKQDALEYYSKASKIFEENHDSLNFAISLQNIGIIYTFFTKLDIARSYFENSLNISRKIHAYSQVANTYQNMGDLEERAGNYRKALDIYEESLEIYKMHELNESAPPSIFYSQVYGNIGKALYNLNQNDKAIEYLKKGYNLAEQTHSYSAMSITALYLSKAYQKSNDYKSAYFNYQLYKQFTDSVNNVPGLQKLIRLQMKYQSDKKMKEQVLEQKVKDLRQKRLQILYISLFITSLMIAVVMFLLFRLQKNKMKNVKLESQNLHNELDFKNKELTTNIMYLLKKNEFIITISEKLRKVDLVQHPELEPLIREVIQELEAGSSMEKWKEFEIRFQDVHKDFYQKLTAKHPDLTTNDLRLCAFIRLNMNTKEVAAITYQSVNSLVVARSRLKQKLNLSKDDSLTTYISSF